MSKFDQDQITFHVADITFTSVSRIVFFENITRLHDLVPRMCTYKPEVPQGGPMRPNLVVQKILL